jgi:hypothetical protein
MHKEWTKIDYQDKHCITDRTDKERRTTEEEMGGPTSP